MDQQPSVSGYQILEKLGCGSYGTVYKAMKYGEVPRDIVAIKCISRDKLQSKAAGDNLVQEIGLLLKLKHRFIVQMKGFDFNSRQITLVLEYCGGGDLSQFIRTHRCLPEGIVRKFLQQLASALHYLHLNSIAHFDLKPSNLLLSSRVPPVFLKLADFGFARVLKTSNGSKETKLSAFRGSPLYMAPEMFTGKGQYDARADLWSVGVILYECLFGRAPFASDSLEELLVQVTSNKEIVIPTRAVSTNSSSSRCNSANSAAITISNSCRDLLLGLLRRDPDQRLSFDAFFAHSFVDLEHAPSEQCLQKVERYATAAVKADNLSLRQKAIRLYCKAVEYCLPALQWVETDTERKQLQARVGQYLNRAEVLRNEASSTASTVSDSDCSTGCNNNTTDSGSVSCTTKSICGTWKDIPAVAAAYTVMSAALELEVSGQFSEALQKYTLAIETLLQVVKAEPKTSDRSLALSADVEAWMSRAEQVKQILESTAGLSLTATVENVESSTTTDEHSCLSVAAECEQKVLMVERATDSLVKDNQCIVQ